MRRLTTKNKRRKSELTEENGVHRESLDENDDMRKGKDKSNDTAKGTIKGSPKKRASRHRQSLQGINNNEEANRENRGRPIANQQYENRRPGKGGANKPLKEEDGKASSSINEDNENDSTVYEVEKIIGQRIIKGKRQFLIRWKGYSENSDTWELEKDLNCLQLINEFLKENEENQENKSKTRTMSPNKVDKRAKKPKLSPKKQADNDKDINASGDLKNDKDDQKEFEVEKILEVHFKKNKTRQFLIRWKGFSSADDTWEPEENLNCPELIEKFMQKVEKAKNSETRELRTNRPHTKRYTLATPEHGRRLSRRNMSKQRATYHECDE